MLKSWSTTQAIVAMSSGEAEFYGLVKAAGAGLGHQSLMDDIGLHLPVRVWTDSSAAIGIASRSGLGKLRHLETHTLWLQEKVNKGQIQIEKVPGKKNIADVLTKHTTGEDHRMHVEETGLERRKGRHELAPETIGTEDLQGM